MSEMSHCFPGKFYSTPQSLYFLLDLYIHLETSCNHKVIGSNPATADVSITSHLSCQNVLDQRTGPLPVHSLYAVWIGVSAKSLKWK